MTEEWRLRLFSPDQAIGEPVVFWLIIIVFAIILASGVVLFLLRKSGRIETQAYQEVIIRWRSWVVIATIVVVPIVLGSVWVMSGVCILSLFCYREFARATGVFREKTISLIVVLGIFLETFAVFDNYSRLFFAGDALTVGLICICTIPSDRPQGYVQRTALGVFGFCCLVTASVISDTSPTARCIARFF